MGVWGAFTVADLLRKVAKELLCALDVMELEDALEELEGC